jgi:hypothetical protein
MALTSTCTVSQQNAHARQLATSYCAVQRGLTLKQHRNSATHHGSIEEHSRAEQSRAEQSRAEQSRAEQSRAEQSRAEHTATSRQLTYLCVQSVDNSAWARAHLRQLQNHVDERSVTATGSLVQRQLAVGVLHRQQASLVDDGAPTHATAATPPHTQRQQVQYAPPPTRRIRRRTRGVLR